jgi:hypothetical protein
LLDRLRHLERGEIRVAAVVSEFDLKAPPSQKWAGRNPKSDLKR